MAASTEQKLDYLLKKIGYTASKTGLAEDSSLSGTKKAPFAEAIPSPLVTPSTTIWNESASIPTTPPGSDTAQVRVYLAGTSGHRMTVDSTVSGSRAFIAYSTYNDTSTAILGDWIDPQFGDAYIIKVYKGDPNSGGVLLSAAGAGSNDTWFFDYSSGVLNFNGTVIPSGVTDNNIYVVGYRYIGVKGIATAGITTSGTSTFKDLNVTGVSTFAGNINANGNIIGDNSTNITGIAGVTATTLTGTLQTAAQTNITSVGTLGALTVSGNVNANGNIVGDNSTNISGISSVTATSLFGALTGTLQTAAQPNITSVGTLTSLNVTGNVSIGGTLTYEDVTNIDSVGLITARTGIKVLAGGINAVGVVTATSFDGSLATTNLTGTITNAQLAGSIANDKLANSTVSYGGISLALGGSDATPAFNLTDATNYPFTSLTGITTTILGDATPKLGGDLNGNSKSIFNVGIITATTFSGNLTGTVNTAAQPNITSLGTLSSLTVSGNINANGNIIGDGATNISGISSLTLASEICHTGNTDTSLAFGTDAISLVTGGVTRFSVSALDSKTQVVGNFEVTGVSTFAGNINANGNIVGDNATNISGINSVTATTYFGDGTKLIGVSTAGISTEGTTTLNNLEVAGISTFTGLAKFNGNFEAAGNVTLGNGTGDNIDIQGRFVRELVPSSNGDKDLGTSSFRWGTLHVKNILQSGGGISTFTNDINVSGVSTFVGIATFQSVDINNGTIDGTNIGFNHRANAQFLSVDASTTLGVDGTSTLNNLNVTGVSTFNNNVKLLDDDKLLLGTGEDLQIYHSSGNNFIDHTTGNLKIRLAGGADFIELQQDRDIYIKGNPAPWDNDTFSLGTSASKWAAVHATTFLGNISGVGATFTNITGTLQTAAQTNITSVGTLGALTVSGNINANGNIVGDNATNISGINSVTATSFFGNISGVGATFTNITGTLQTAAQTNITSVGTLTSLDVSGNITGAGDLTLTDTDTGSSAAPIINLYRNSASPADADYLGQIKFQGESDTGVQRNYAKITGKILDASNGTEDGILEFAFLKAGSNNISGRFRSDSLQLLNGTNFSVAGDSTFTGDINANGNIVGDNSTNITGISGVTATTLTGTLQTAAQTNITSVGTLTSLNVTGDVSIGGTLTYEDVTNIDSLGIITARTGIKVLAGGIDAVGVVTVTGVLKIPDGGGSSNRISVGDSEDLKIYHTGNNSTIKHDNGSGDLYLDSLATGSDIHLRSEAEFAVQVGGNTHIQAYKNGGTSLLQAGSKKLETLTTGARVTGTLDVTDGITVAGNINANGNIIGDNATNISGINSVTASAFYGDGSNLSNIGFTTSVGTFNASSGVATIDSFAHATEDYKVAEYTLHFTNGSNIQAQKLLVMQDGSTAYSQEFAVMSSGSQLVSLDATISGANVLVRATPESGISGTTTFIWRRIVQE